jgi:hypothetical protein
VKISVERNSTQKYSEPARHLLCHLSIKHDMVQKKEIVIMASKSLFKSLVGMLAPKTDAINEAGGTAYEFNAQHQLAQYAATGCLNGHILRFGRSATGDGA